MSPLDQDDDLHPSRSREREFTLSIGAILGLLCSLVLLCGVFFGFGYNMGSKAKQTAQITEPAAPTPAPNLGGLSKPAAGSYTIGRTNGGTHPSAPPPAANPTASPAPAPIVRQPAPAPRPQSVSITPSSAPPSATASTRAATPPAPQSATSAEATPSGSFLVQVAAVSHPEDAQMLVGALRARGYSVVSHTSPSDSYYHVQVGPFGNRKDADAMRQRLLTDGYNAVIK